MSRCESVLRPVDGSLVFLSGQLYVATENFTFIDLVLSFFKAYVVYALDSL